MKTNYLICPGEACPLRLLCQRFMAWLDNEDEHPDEMIPAFKDGKCPAYEEKPFYAV